MLDNSNRISDEAKKYLKPEEVAMLDDWHIHNGLGPVSKFQATTQIYVANILEASATQLNVSIQNANKLLKELNKTIKDADKSSAKLTEALNRITFWGVIIAAVSLLVAALSVGLDYYQFFLQD